MARIWLPAGALPCATSAASAVTSTSLNSSFAVLPSSAFSADGSCSPGTCTTMRLSPWRMIVGSRVPSSSMRLRMTSTACSIALLTAAAMPASVGVRTTRLPSLTATSTSRCPDTPIGRVTLRSVSTAWSSLVGSVTMKLSTPALIDRSVNATGPPSVSRSSLRTVSSRPSSLVLRTSSVCASSRMWLPPRRSRPRLSCFDGTNDGQVATCASVKKLGSANSKPSSSTRPIDHTFHCGKSSIAAGFSSWRRWRRRAAAASPLRRACPCGCAA